MSRRCFLALRVTGDREDLAAWWAGAADRFPAVRWVDPDGLHLTLAFFPALADATVSRLALGGSLGSHPDIPETPVPLARTPRIGGFGGVDGLRVVFVAPGPEHGAWLASLRQLVAVRLMQAASLVLEEAWVPHVTLGRARRAPVAPGALPPPPRSLQVDPRAVVFLERGAGVPRHGPYRELARWPLDPVATG